MAHFVCPCLNVHIFCVKGQQHQQLLANNLKSSWPETPRDQFFVQPLCEAVLDAKGIVASQACLVGSRLVDKWTINTCLSCRKDTHATSQHTDSVLINTSALLSNATQIRTLLLSPNYSQLYRLILPPALDNPVSENSGSLENCQMRSVIQSIRQQATNHLLQEQKQMEETVRAFTEQQFALYAALQSRVTSERQAFIDLLSSIYRQQEKPGMKMVFPSPCDHFPSPPTSPDNSESGSSNDLTLDRMDAASDILPKTVVLSRNLQRNARQRPAKERVPRNNCQLPSGDDDNAIFDMDGLDDEDGAAFPVSEDEDDTDDSTSEDLQVGRWSASRVSPKCASSVPISVPFMTMHSHVNSTQENPALDDPSQIAASIQALALSMRDDREMFGDRPRRRLNTGDLVKSRPI